jgi:hypothetical protein
VPNAQERLQQPFDERATLQDDVGAQCHIGLQRHFVAVRLDGLTLELDLDPIGGIFDAGDRHRHFGGSEHGGGDGVDGAAIAAEALEWKAS